MTSDSTHIRIRPDDKIKLEQMAEERGISSMPDFIHYLIYIDKSRTNPYDELEMEVRRLRVELDEMKKKAGEE